MIYAEFHNYLIIEANNLNINECMRNFVQSDQLISPPKGKISNQSLESIPPGSQKMKIAGVCTIKVETQYLNTLRQNTTLRCKFWGMEGQGIVFESISQRQKVLNLNVRSNLENVSRYFKDMKGLCLEVMHPLTKQRSGSLEKKNRTTQYKQIGWIFLNPQRYIINHVFNDFEEKVNIIDMRKQKIGEAKVKMFIDMYPQYQEEFYPHPTVPEINKPPSLLQIEQIRPKRQREERVNPILKQNNQENIQKNDNFSAANEQETDNIKIRRDRIDVQRQNIIDYDNRKDFFPEFKRKSRAQQYLEQYQKSKPEHTQLSMIRDKFGFNNPSVEVMKLKYDEVKLLCKTSEEPDKDETRINIVLKSIKLENPKTKIDNLIIYCEEKNSSLKTETKLFLSEAISQKIDINYLYMLPNCPSDILSFQIKDGKAEIAVSQLIKTNKIELKNKNNKRIAIIEFHTISDRQVKKSNQQIQNPKPTNDQNNKKENDVQQHLIAKKIKDTAYLFVFNWKEDKITLKNKNFGIISANKLLFELNDPLHNTVEVILEDSKKQRTYLQVQLAQLFKEQNYNIMGKNVKIISARGPSSDLLNLISKLEPEKHSSQAQINQKQSENQVSDRLQLIKKMVSIFQNLAISENVQCNELIEELINANQLSLKQLSKLSNLIEICNQDFSRVLQIFFDSNFELFFRNFQVYHQWNHKYQIIQRKIKKIFDRQYLKKLLRVQKKLKKSNEVMFGVINSASIIAELVKDQENNSSQMDSQSIGRIVVLLTQRYFNRSVKLSQFQRYLTEEGYLLTLNAYLLCKLSNEITCEIDSFKDHLSESELSFIHLFELERQFSGQQGLAKLILTEDEDLTESQITSHQSEHTRRQTEPHQGLNIRTQQSKQPQKKHREEHQRSAIQQHSIDDLQHEKSTQKCAVIIKKLQLPFQSVKKINILNQNDKIELNLVDIPKAISLLENEVYRIEVLGEEEVLQGVFVAISQSQKVQLFLHNQQMGVAYFGSKKDNTEQSQIAFQLVTTHKQLQKDKEQIVQFSRRQQNEEAALDLTHQSAKSPYIKMTIRSIKPSRPEFKLKINKLGEEASQYLQYPESNQLVIQNSPKGWIIQLTGQYEDILVPNYLNSNTYCFINSEDKKIAYMAIIQIQQCWDSDVKALAPDSLHIYVHFQELICLNNLEVGSYELVMQNQHELKHLTTVDYQLYAKKIPLNSFVMLKNTSESLNIKVINSKTKKQIAQFIFTIKVITEGAERCERYLLANQTAYRLKTTVIQIRHEWNYCKPDRILRMFEPANKKAIQSWYHQNHQASEKQLITWLRGNFELTLGQIDIMLYQLVKGEDSDWKMFMKLFEAKQYESFREIQQIQEQFYPFDINSQGLVDQNQLKMVKRTLERNFSSIAAYLKEMEMTFTTEVQKQNNFIIDLMAQKTSQFDYLSFISLFTNKFQVQPKQEKKHVGQVKKEEKYIHVKLLSFDKLSINGKPDTFFFMIRNQPLAEPKNRCYSYTYPYSEAITFENKKPLQLEIYSRKLKSQCKLLDKVPLEKQIKIFGGTINFEIFTSNQPYPQAQKPVNPRQLSPIERQNQEQQQPQLNDSRFQKSFWNKSLQETKQKWTKTHGLTDPARKRKLHDLIDDDELIRKKKELFDKEWE